MYYCLARETGLDLTVFHTASHNFDTFMKAISSRALHTETTVHDVVKFESVLQRVVFPQLSRDFEGNPHERKEVQTVLNWLRSNSVTKIRELIVPDCFDRPHNEGTINDCIQGFGIEVLNWRRLDLSIDAITEKNSEIRVLDLYSNGNWAALSHWRSQDGLKRLTQVTHFHVIPVHYADEHIQLETVSLHLVAVSTNIEDTTRPSVDLRYHRSVWALNKSRHLRPEQKKHSDRCM